LADEKPREAQFLKALKSSSAKKRKTVSLMCISLGAKGIPTSLFTVNRWVTGDHLLSADSTLALLKNFRVATPGFELINEWLQAMIGLFWPQIVDLLRQRDIKLKSLITNGHTGVNLLDDNAVELLSEFEVDIDRQVGWLMKGH
jgi:hypothetical protein